MQQSIDTAGRRLTVEEFLEEYADRPGTFALPIAVDISQFWLH
jgi:hypothetical protein